MNVVDHTYKQVVREVLSQGNFKRNRTDVATISKFGVSYTLENDKRFPLLTTKKMDGARWNSMVHELLWYLSGEHHIRNLREHTSIWDEWADEDGHLDTAYGRFWREYPSVDPTVEKEGESWAKAENEYMGSEYSEYTFDQIEYVIDNLKNNPNSRRHVVTAWHPANATVSTLPPCHLMFIFNVQNGDELNVHLTQRSGDIALGVPFNIACYALLQALIARETGLKVGKFHHSITDAHIYCGKGERADWWEENMDALDDVYSPTQDIEKIAKAIEHLAPADPDNYDHIPGLLRQSARSSYSAPQVKIASKSIDDIEYDDIELLNYESHDSIQFGVAE